MRDYYGFWATTDDFDKYENKNTKFTNNLLKDMKFTKYGHMHLELHLFSFGETL